LDTNCFHNMPADRSGMKEFKTNRTNSLWSLWILNQLLSFALGFVWRLLSPKSNPFYRHLKHFINQIPGILHLSNYWPLKT
jgi:hypothetical protein